MPLESSCSNTVSTQVTHAVITGAPGGVAGPPGPPGCPILARTTVIENPTIGRAYLGYFNAEANISKIVVLLKGSSPVISGNISHGVNFLGVGTPMFAANFSVDNVSSGQTYVISDFVTDTNVVAEGSHMWLNLTSVSAGVDDVIVTVVFRGECEPIVVTGGGSDPGGGTGTIDLTNVGIRLESASGQVAYLDVVDHS